MALAAFLLWRGRLFDARWMLWILMLALPFPYIANTAGWMTAELGRQPWLVYGLMRTAEGFSPNVSAGNALFTLLGFMGMYTVLGILFLFLVWRRDRRTGPDGDDGTPQPARRAREPIRLRRTHHGNALVRPRRVDADGLRGAGRLRPRRGRRAPLRRAQTSASGALVLRAIGPVWDGNEVWLLAAGGTLYFAFPLLYASSFSGFYLPLMMVLWLLMLRGIGIEFRDHVDDPLWRPLLRLSSSPLASVAAGDLLRRGARQRGARRAARARTATSSCRCGPTSEPAASPASWTGTRC